MKLCADKQEECKYYSPVSPVGFEDVYLPDAGARFLHNVNDNYMLFILSGEIEMNFGPYQNKSFGAGDMFFLPRNMEFQGTVIAPAHLTLLKYNNIKFPCMEDAIRMMLKKKAEGNFKWDKISIKPELRRVIDDLIHYRLCGLTCSHIYLIKAQEIYLIFKHFYTDEERIQVYYPFIGRDPVFAEAVMSNFMHVKTVEEFAADLGYGVKTFRELFKVNFGKTPYKWMQQQLAHQVRSKLMKREIPLKSIMFEYGFTTNSHFITFCRNHFGGTPMEVRNGKVPGNIRVI